MDKPFLIISPKDAAKKLGYSRRNIYRMVRMKRIVGRKIRSRLWVWVEL
jgi:predicted DNA-binding transcriptional regulator AlpA